MNAMLQDTVGRVEKTRRNNQPKRYSLVACGGARRGSIFTCLVRRPILSWIPFLALMVGTFSLHAEYVDFDGVPDGYVCLTSNDSSSRSSFESSGGWSDGLPPSSGKRYYVGRTASTSPMQLYFPRTAITENSLSTFMGDELRTRGKILRSSNKFSFYEIPLMVAIGAADDISVHGKQGIGAQFAYSGCATPLRGTVRIEGSNVSQLPYSAVMFLQNASLYDNPSVRTQEEEFAVEGDETQCIDLVAQNDAGVVTKNGITRTSTFGWVFKGDLSRYYGTFHVNPYVRVSITGTCSGTVHLESDAILATAWPSHSSYFCNCSEGANTNANATVENVVADDGASIVLGGGTSLTVGTLSLDGTATIDVLQDANHVAGRMIITKALSFGGVVTVNLSLDATEGLPTRYEVMRTAAGVETELVESMFNLVVPKKVGDLPHAWLEISRDQSTGEQVVEVVMREIVTRTAAATGAASNGSDRTDLSPLDSAANAEGLAYWSDGKSPSAGKDYLVPPRRSIHLPSGVAPVNFLGASLTFDDGANLVSGYKVNPGAAGISIPSISFVDGYMRIWSGNVQDDSYSCKAVPISGGKICTFAGKPSTFWSQASLLYRFESSFCGDGDVIFQTAHSSSESARIGYFDLVADNTAFTGSYAVTYDSAGISGEGMGSTLYVHNGRNLGAALEEFRPDAFKVECHSTVRVDGDVAMPANRGLTAGDCRFEIAAGKSFATSSPMTLSGTLRLTGDGMFVINDRADAAPGAVVEVLSGCLKVCATNSLAGVSVSLGENSSLVFDANPISVAVAKYGLSGAKLPQDGNIAITLDTRSKPTLPANAELTVGLLTLGSKAEAEAIVKRLRVSKAYPNTHNIMSVAQNDLGTWTVSVRVKFCGLSVVIR